MSSCHRAIAWAGCMAVGFCVTASGVINPNYTPSDLIRQAARVYFLEISVPKDHVLKGEVKETLAGNPPAEKTILLDLSGALELTEEGVIGAFGPKKTAPAILLLKAVEKDNDPEAPVGALQINTLWFAVYDRNGKQTLDRDKQTLFAVWGGSAPMLAAAARRLPVDPGLSFPVRSDIAWGSELVLGKITGTVHGGLMVDLGAPHGLCAVLFSDKGDRIYQAGSQDGPPADITAKAALPTKSKRLIPGDFDGDGRHDFASWDGKHLRVALQAADGTFSLRKGSTPLAECLSLDVLNVGAKTPGLLAGTAAGPVLLVPEGGTGFAAKPVPGVSPEMLQKLGPGGYCVAADFNADGRCDTMQLFAKGALLFAGEAPGTFNVPVLTLVRLAKNPQAAVPGDYDVDGQLDLIVCGEGALALLSHTDSSQLDNYTYVTGELAYHGNANRPTISGGSAFDVNSDGRQGVALFHPDRKPMFFFNRGFGCFGWARELDLVGGAGMGAGMMVPGIMGEEPPKAELKALGALQSGQKAGIIMDLNGDSVPDMLAVDPTGNVWALFAEGGMDRPLNITLALPPRSLDPVTVTVSNKKHRSGMYVVRPGIPAVAGRAYKGAMTVQWSGPDGKSQTSTSMIVRSKKIEIRTADAPVPK